ncbi:hypothetical protein SEA_MAGRITTE_43 [Microbacterium phage Magritte]|nr:hypothetical protein SEA_MAGRITTE_43 [Microbacterium phage Magritte]
MLAQDIIYLAGDIVLLTAIPALALFVVFYYYKSPWKTLLVGRSLMYFAVSLLAIIAVVALSVWLGTDYFLREWVRLISYLLVSITTWRLFFTLRHIQKQGVQEVTEIGLGEHPIIQEPTKGGLLQFLFTSRKKYPELGSEPEQINEPHKENHS